MTDLKTVESIEEITECLTKLFSAVEIIEKRISINEKNTKDILALVTKIIESNIKNKQGEA